MQTVVVQRTHARHERLRLVSKQRTTELPHTRLCWNLLTERLVQYEEGGTVQHLIILLIFTIFFF